MTQTNITKIRRNEIKELMITVLQTNPNCELPVKIKELTRSHKNIRLIPYSKHMKKMGLTYQQMISYANTNDACTDYYAECDLYIIYYNDIDPAIVRSNRYRWNIAHELGHIFLKHHINNNKTRIFRNGLSQTEYNELEDEADYFAQLLLVPHAVLWGLNVSTRQQLYLECQISWPASWHRFNDYKEWYKKIGKDSYDYRIHNLYYTFLYQKDCSYCKSTIIQRSNRYCSICGSRKTLQRGDRNKMIYPSYDTDENGRLKKCIICNNEHLIDQYCHICGTDVINYCTNATGGFYDYGQCNNTSPLPSNARYCPSCGSESTFYRKKILKAWNYDNTLSTDGFSNIPDSFDEELPFPTSANPTTTNDVDSFLNGFSGFDVDFPFD